ncbi:MAG: hypothetical protein HJJLKODD_01933 [Phycisphaerae bacterium]|nr:hypothetical protein [Phycisphaerae bacterium]
MVNRINRKSLVLFLCGGCMFQLGLGACQDLARFANPCGTVLTTCDPADIDVQSIGTLEAYNDYPNCTIPLACGEGSPFEGIGGGLFGTGPGPRPSGPGTD